ncbi:MAG TPA: hypothetical protein VKE69_07020, partial [Planctomycetota bacterium]|nr:hypothetical protein [Planctomycetota bacterium]
MTRAAAPRGNRMSIRRRLLTSVLLTAALPLAGAVPLLELVMRRSVERTAMLEIRQAHRRSAECFQSGIEREIARVVQLSRHPEVSEELAGAGARGAESRPEHPVDRIARIESEWRSLGSDVEKQVASRPSSRRFFNETQIGRSTLVELVLADSGGETIAASPRPLAYRHADQPWWSGAWAGGRGALYV